jgi:thiol-disulfide isomerase/thioredoxin
MTLGVLGLFAALLLAGVFVTAGITKLADRPGTRKAIEEFGAPRLVAPLTFALPLAEFTVAGLLVAAPTRAIGAVGALMLLGLFSGAIAVGLAQGRAPDCHCFGQLHSAPASWKTLVRNGVLAVLAVVALTAGVAGETPSAVAWIGELSGAGLLALVVSVAAAGLATAGVLAFLSLLRSYGTVLVRLDGIEQRLAAAGIDTEAAYEAPPEIGLEPGSIAPAFVAAAADGTSVSLDDLLAPGLPLLLLFTSPTCGPCQALLPDVAAWQAEHADRLTIAIANGGDPKASLAEAEAHGLERVLSDQELAVYEAYHAAGTPSAVLVAPDGTIASHVAPGTDWIEQLLARTLGDEEGDEGLPVGSPVPELVVPTLDGEPIAFTALAGQETLVLFWNPDCGFCNSMRDELLAWEQDTPAGAPRLVIVSSGDEASTRAEGFSSTVALDADFAAGSAFEAGGTPMAVLLDRDGRIASPLVAGAEDVFALAGRRTETADQPVVLRSGS